MKILLTGAAGFIGHHVAKGLLERGDTVVGIDNFNNYCCPSGNSKTPFNSTTTTMAKC